MQTFLEPAYLAREKMLDSFATAAPGGGAEPCEQKAIDRFHAQWPNAILVHTPVHASWINQVEIYFSIVQGKVLTPNNFASLAELEQHLLAFQSHCEPTAGPFKWTFTRSDLQALLAKLDAKPLAPAA